MPKSAVLGQVGKGIDVIEQAVDEATLAIGAEAVGCMEVLYKATVEYCKTRKQFGQPIGKFQVLQHRMVDMFMEYEQSKSLMFMVTMRLAEGYGPEAQKAVSAFKVQVGKSGRFVGQNAVQLHGGMGMTDELNIGHYFKRLTMIDTMFGNVDHHLKRFGRFEPRRSSNQRETTAGSDHEQMGSPEFEHGARLVLESSRDRIAASSASKSKSATWRIAVGMATNGRGLLFIHGMNAHSRWWDFIAPAVRRSSIASRRWTSPAWAIPTSATNTIPRRTPPRSPACSTTPASALTASSWRTASAATWR